MKSKDVYCYCIEPDFRDNDIIPKCHKCGGIKPINSKKLTSKPKITKVKIPKSQYTKEQIKALKEQQRSLL